MPNSGTKRLMYLSIAYKVLGRMDATQELEL
jgi:hypothetical protein